MYVNECEKNIYHSQFDAEFNNQAKAYLTKKNRVEDNHYKTYVDFGLSRKHHIMMLLLPFQHMKEIHQLLCLLERQLIDCRFN